MTPDQAFARVRILTQTELRAVAEATGIPKSTLSKIRYGETSDPRLSTVRKLIEHFERAARMRNRAPRAVEGDAA